MRLQPPELVPVAFSQGFTRPDAYYSARQKGLRLRRSKGSATGEVFLVRPALGLPYLGATTDEVEQALYWRQWGVPLAARAYVFGRDALFYSRAWGSLGRNAGVGTTVKSAAKLPAHLRAEEKHTGRGGERPSVAPPVGDGCFLGAAVVAEASTAALHAGYGAFLTEARALAPAYAPETVGTEGWHATRAAWQLLVPTVPLLLWFLPAVLKIEARCRGAVRQQLRRRAGHVSQATTKAHFAQRVRRWREGARGELAGAGQAPGLKLGELKAPFMLASDFPAAARTTTGIDRLMDYQDRVLYALRSRHGTQESGRWAVRAMALQWNFHPYRAQAHRHGAKRSPFEALNGFPYHDNWLHNLLSAASMGGRRL